MEDTGAGFDTISSPIPPPTSRFATFPDLNPMEIDRTVLALHDCPLIPFDDMDFDLAHSVRDRDMRPDGGARAPSGKTSHRIVLKPFASATDCELTVKLLRAHCNRGMPVEKLVGLDILAAISMGL
jgi:hypothetical protein